MMKKNINILLTIFFYSILKISFFANALNKKIKPFDQNNNLTDLYNYQLKMMLKCSQVILTAQWWINDFFNG